MRIRSDRERISLLIISPLCEIGGVILLSNISKMEMDKSSEAKTVIGFEIVPVLRLLASMKTLI